LDGDLLEFNEICIALQRRTDDCLLKAEAAERTADQLSLQWEEITETLEHSHLVESPTNLDSSNMEPELHSPPWAEHSASISGGRRPPGSAGSEVESKERDRKERQSFWDSAFGKESRHQRPYGMGDALDENQASPPSRGQSRNGKAPRSFLSGLRRKGKESTPLSVGSLDKDGGADKSGGAGGSAGSWGMI